MTRVLWICALGFWLTAAAARAGVETVEIEKIQVVGAISGTVSDSSGAPVAAAKIEEVSPDWKTVIRSSTADKNGCFELKPDPNWKLYHIVISAHNFNSTRMRVRLSRKSIKQLDVRLAVST